jgi:uncharacterized repeat protein (TIGR03806 family)
MPQGYRLAPRYASTWLVVTACAALVSSGCNLGGHRDVHPFLNEPFPEKLSAWHLFAASAQGGHLAPNAGVLPYDLNTPLFSDYADKYRFVWMPSGSSAVYKDDVPFEFPVGTIFAKSFAFPVEGRRGAGEERLIETRLLVHTKSAWVPLPYIWNASQTEATLQIVPDPVHIRYTDGAGRGHDFTYQVPNTNECHECHDNNKSLQPIGPKARNLNKDFSYRDGTANQLARWTTVGYLRGAPEPAAAPRAARWSEPTTGSLDSRALAYLDNNCAHCHQPGGTAGYTGVDFRLGHFDARRFGICKHPNSAGNMGDRRYDLVPGRPDQSILVYRLESTAPKIMMPQIGRAVVHAEGVALTREWVSSLPGASCGAFASR